MFGSIVGAFQRIFGKAEPSTLVMVKQCADALRDCGGLDEEHVFRIPGSKAEIDSLVKKLKKGNGTCLKTASSPHAIASTMKSILVNAKQPVINRTLHNSIIGALDLKGDARTRTISEIIGKIDPQSLELLRFLLHFFDEILEHKSANLMNFKAMGVVLAPALFGGIVALPGDMPDPTFVLKQTDCCQWLMEHHSQIHSINPDGASNSKSADLQAT